MINKIVLVVFCVCAALFVWMGYSKDKAVKDDLMAYEAQEAVITKKYLDKGQEIQQRMAVLQKTQDAELHQALVDDSRALMDSLAAELAAIKPQTERVKQFNEFYIQSTQKNQMAVVNLLDAMLNNDATAMNDGMQKLQTIDFELQIEKNSLRNDVNASAFLNLGAK